MSFAGAYDFDLDSASRWQETLSYNDDDGVPENLTDFTSRLRVYETVDTDPVLDITPTLGGIAGTIAWDVSATDIAAALTRPRYRYNIELKPGGTDAEAFTLLRGFVNVQRSPTP